MTLQNTFIKYGIDFKKILLYVLAIPVFNFSLLNRPVPIKRQFESTLLMPGYFRFLTLVAYHTLLSEKVDATILEVGVGGTYDSTNIVPRPIVTGVTALGLDHVNVLGKTLKEIAWQKGGIYKVRTISNKALQQFIGEGS